MPKAEGVPVILPVETPVQFQQSRTGLWPKTQGCLLEAMSVSLPDVPPVLLRKWHGRQDPLEQLIERREVTVPQTIRHKEQCVLPPP